MSGANLDICLIGAVGNRTGCFSQAGVDVAGGQRVGTFEAALNVRFDIYAATANNLRNNPDYPPAPNVLSSYEPAQGLCIGSQPAVFSSTMGLPPDDCFGSGGCTRFGNGDWTAGRQDYIDINYNGTDPYPNASTRCDYYLAEIGASAGLSPGVGFGQGLTGIVDGILPQWFRYVSDDPDRRVFVAASIDCTTVDVSAGASNVPVIEFVELFMMAPVGLDGTKDLWVEVIGGESGGSNEEAQFCEVVQLYR